MLFFLTEDIVVVSMATTHTKKRNSHIVTHTAFTMDKNLPRKTPPRIAWNISNSTPITLSMGTRRSNLNNMEPWRFSNINLLRTRVKLRPPDRILQHRGVCDLLGEWRGWIDVRKTVVLWEVTGIYLMMRIHDVLM